MGRSPTSTRRSIRLRATGVPYPASDQGPKPITSIKLIITPPAARSRHRQTIGKAHVAAPSPTPKTKENHVLTSEVGSGRLAITTATTDILQPVPTTSHQTSTPATPTPIPVINQGTRGEDVSHLQLLGWLATGTDDRPDYVTGFVQQGYRPWCVYREIHHYHKASRNGYAVAESKLSSSSASPPYTFPDNSYSCSDLRSASTRASRLAGIGAPHGTTHPGPNIVTPSGARV